MSAGPAGRPSRPRVARRPGLGVALLALLALLGLVAGAACGSDGAAAPTEGIAGRQAPAPVDVAASSGKDSCFSEASVLPAGRDATGSQHYLLTFRLKSNPSDEVALRKTLSAETCQEAHRSALTSATTEAAKGGAKAAVDVSYLTKGGRRFTLP